VLTNAGVERLLEKERALGADIKFADIAPEVADVYPRVMFKGEMDAGAWSCGMVARLIHDIPTVAELVSRIMREADDIIRKRLEGMLMSWNGESRCRYRLSALPSAFTLHRLSSRKVATRILVPMSESIQSPTVR
jgi:hypothetical protein